MHVGMDTCVDRDSSLIVLPLYSIDRLSPSNPQLTNMSSLPSHHALGTPCLLLPEAGVTGELL